MAQPAAHPLGVQLKHWRRVRGVSQLQLALHAGVSSRHLSFIETGRAQPSSGMVLKLADALDVPLRERNELLHAAGYAPRFTEHRIDAPDLAQMRYIVQRMLDDHDPFPGFAIDRLWRIVATNATARRLFGALLDAAGETPSAVELFLGSGMMQAIVENWSEVAWSTLTRLRHEAFAAGNDRELNELLARAEQLLQGINPPDDFDVTTPTITSRMRFGDRLVRTVSTIASFQSASDVTLSELRIELVFPADAASEAFFVEMSER